VGATGKRERERENVHPGDKGAYYIIYNIKTKLKIRYECVNLK
jgi:hypothetical protein